MTSLYLTGTVSVTAGSAVVNGVGTAWKTALIVGGLFGLAGASLPILSIDSDTQLTLARPWAGASAAGQAYWISRDTSQGRQAGANANALAQIISELRSAAIAAVAGLTPATDKIAYFVSSTTAALADFKAKGRDIVAAATTLELLGKFGPVHGGLAPAPSAATVGLTDGDFNLVTVPGVYTIASDWINGPYGSSSYTGVLIVYARSYANGFWQEYLFQERRFRRFTNAAGGTSGWTDWRAVAGEVVGTVSMGSGYASGAVMEPGNNANGTYAKFADGTLICTRASLTLKEASDTTSGIKSATWNYPASFAAAPTVLHSIGSGRPDNRGITTALPDRSSATLSYYESQGIGSLVSTFAIAVGRWQ